MDVSDWLISPTFVALLGVFYAVPLDGCCVSCNDFPRFLCSWCYCTNISWCCCSISSKWTRYACWTVPILSFWLTEFRLRVHPNRSQSGWLWLISILDDPGTQFWSDNANIRCIHDVVAFFTFYMGLFCCACYKSHRVLLDKPCVRYCMFIARWSYQ